MDQLLALAVTVPLIVAAGISALNPLFRHQRRVLDSIAIVTAASVTAMLVVVMVRAAAGSRSTGSRDSGPPTASPSGSTSPWTR